MRLFYYILFLRDGQAYAYWTVICTSLVTQGLVYNVTKMRFPLNPELYMVPHGDACSLLLSGVPRHSMIYVNLLSSQVIKWNHNWSDVLFLHEQLSFYSFFQMVPDRWAGWLQMAGRQMAQCKGHWIKSEMTVFWGLGCHRSGSWHWDDAQATAPRGNLPEPHYPLPYPQSGSDAPLLCSCHILVFTHEAHGTKSKCTRTGRYKEDIKHLIVPKIK